MKYGIIIVLILSVLLVVFFALKYDWSPSYTADPALDVNPFLGVTWNPLIDGTGKVYNALGQQI